MSNLKTYLDAAIAADAEKQRLMQEIDALFNDGTEDGKKKALELRPALDDAKSKAEQANQLYTSMRDASLVNDNAAALFTPADPAATDSKDADPKVMKVSEYRALSPSAKLAFGKQGGKLED